MTIIKLMKTAPLSAAQKKTIAKVSDFVIHPKGSAIIKPKEFGLRKVKVDKAGSMRPNTRVGRGLKNTSTPFGYAKANPRAAYKPRIIKKNYKPTSSDWKRYGRIAGRR